MRSRVGFPRAVAVVLATLAAFAACSTNERSEGRALGEGARTGVAVQDLSQAAQAITGADLPTKTLALTFDDGPGDFASQLSTYLKDQGIRATFFINGLRVTTSTLNNLNGITQTANANAILAQIQADGHLIANHTTTHRDMTSEVPSGQLVQELSDTDAVVSQYTAVNRLLFRAPYGNWNNTDWNTLKVSAMNKYVGPVYWTEGGNSNQYPNAAADWACWQGQLLNTNGTKANGTGYATTQQCGDAYLNEIASTPGQKGIVLMHDPYSWAQGNTLAMVQYIVPKLKALGYSFVRVDEVPSVYTQLACNTSCATCAKPNLDTCTSCAGGKYLQAGTCQTCSACAPGTYASVACSANADTVCTACDVACSACTGGGNAACTSCNAGYWLNGTTCMPCTACAAGTYASAACTPTSDTVCSACDASCATCTGPSANQCGTCPAGKFLANGACTTCSTCAAGTYASAACNASADTVCTACAAGTWSGANATSCTSCGTCDDGDTCTTDACDATKGCTHTAINGCTHAADAGTSSGGGNDAGTSSGGSTSSSSGGSSSGGSTSSGSTSSSSGSTDDAGAPGGTNDPPGETGGGCATSPVSQHGDLAGVLVGLAMIGSAARRRRRRC